MALGSLLGGVGGLIADLTGGKQGKGKYQRALDVIANLESPDFDMSDVLSPVYRPRATMESAFYSPARAEVQALAEDNPEARLAQMGALRQLSEISREGIPLADRIRGMQGQRMVSDTARRNQEAVLQNLAARGRLGGGTEATVRAVANQQASNLAGSLGGEMIRAALERRAGAAAQAGALGSQIRGQDIGLSESRANTLNRFNELMTNQMNQAAAFNAANRQQANAANFQNLQNLANATESARYSSSTENINRQNQLRQALADWQLRQAGAEASAAQQLGGWEERRHAQNVQNAVGIGEGVGGTIEWIGGGGLEGFGGGGSGAGAGAGAGAGGGGGYGYV